MDNPAATLANPEPQDILVNNPATPANLVVILEANLVVTLEANPVAIPADSLAVILEANPEVSLVVSPVMEVSLEAIPVDSLAVIPVVNREVILEVSLEDTPEASLEDTLEVSPEVSLVSQEHTASPAASLPEVNPERTANLVASLPAALCVLLDSPLELFPGFLDNLSSAPSCNGKACTILANPLASPLVSIRRFTTKLIRQAGRSVTSTRITRAFSASTSSKRRSTTSATAGMMSTWGTSSTNWITEQTAYTSASLWNGISAPTATRMDDPRVALGVTDVYVL